jgi:hypothetical protein
MPAAGCPSLATPVRVVHGIHHDPAHVGPPAQPACLACFSIRDVLVFQVAELPDRGLAAQVDEPDFTRGQANVRVVAFLGEKLGHRPGGTDHLGPFARPHLDVVNQGAEGDETQRQGVARLNVGGLAGDDPIANFQAIRCQDVPFFPICVVEQGDSGRPVRVVFDGSDLCRNVGLVPFEIDESIPSLVAAAPVPGSDSAVTVAAPFLGQAADEGLLGLRGCDLLEEGVRLMRKSA